MSGVYADEWLTVYQGDCRAVMASMEPESVHCVVTSPPYWGLRDYGDAGQLGLEPTPEEYVANLVDVFREVRRVLRSDGTVWLNLGDSYASSSTYNTTNTLHTTHGWKQDSDRRPNAYNVPGLKHKDLVGIPWRVAFALQADGWYLRSDIIWSKPNPMPESVTDRPTKSHEYLFLLSKSPRYYFDADAVREKSEWVDAEGHPIDSWGRRSQPPTHHLEGRPYSAVGLDPIKGGRGVPASLGAGVTDGRRNIRSVWNIATQPYPGAHFATFPRKLVEPCIKAGTSERGVCPECGAPWVRVVERAVDFTSGSGRAGRPPAGKNGSEYEQATSGTYDIRMGPSVRAETTGWSQSCGHNQDWFDPENGHGQDAWAPIPATVLDPFAGSGTTGLVAQSLSRRAILIDLNADYLIQAMGRNRDIPLGLAG